MSLATSAPPATATCPACGRPCDVTPAQGIGRVILRCAACGCNTVVRLGTPPAEPAPSSVDGPTAPLILSPTAMERAMSIRDGERPVGECIGLAVACPCCGGVAIVEAVPLRSESSGNYVRTACRIGPRLVPKWTSVKVVEMPDVRPDHRTQIAKNSDTLGEYWR